MSKPILADTVQVIVTRPRGTWKWHNAYAVATYTLAFRESDGQPYYQFVSRGPKRSRPQLGDLFTELPHGRPTV